MDAGRGFFFVLFLSFLCISSSMSMNAARHNPRHRSHLHHSTARGRLHHSGTDVVPPAKVLATAEEGAPAEGDAAATFDPAASPEGAQAPASDSPASAAADPSAAAPAPGAADPSAAAPAPGAADPSATTPAPGAADSAATVPAPGAAGPAAASPAASTEPAGPPPAAAAPETTGASPAAAEPAAASPAQADPPAGSDERSPKTEAKAAHSVDANLKGKSGNTFKDRAQDKPVERSSMREEVDDVDSHIEVPYEPLQPFGREDIAKETTEKSIRESDALMKQLERTAVAEEKRAVFRVFANLRTLVNTGFNAILRAEAENIDRHAKENPWTKNNKMRYLAQEEEDFSKA